MMTNDAKGILNKEEINSVLDSIINEMPAHNSIWGSNEERVRYFNEGYNQYRSLALQVLNKYRYFNK
jgi:hypothetical protein